MFTEHLLYAGHCKTPKHNSDLEDRPISSCFLCSVGRVDTEKKDYGSSVKEDFLEVASQWSVEVSEGGGAKRMSGTTTCLHQAPCLCWGRRHFLMVELGGAGKTPVPRTT